MSLKFFHILFILLSIALCAGFSMWAFRDYASENVSISLGLGVLSAIAVPGLLFYLIQIIKKFKKL